MFKTEYQFYAVFACIGIFFISCQKAVTVPKRSITSQGSFNPNSGDVNNYSSGDQDNTQRANSFANSNNTFDANPYANNNLSGNDSYTANGGVVNTGFSLGTNTSITTNSIINTILPPFDAKFAKSCFGGTNKMMNCCEVDRHTGEISCVATSSYGNGWPPYSQKPFSAGANSTYGLSCFSTGTNIKCCQIDMLSNTIKCAQTTSSKGSWTATLPNLTASATSTSHGLSCFQDASFVTHCCQNDTQTGETNCSVFPNSIEKSWVAYTSKPFNVGNNSSYQLSCFAIGSSPNCCQFDLNANTSQCMQASSYTATSWTAYTNPPFDASMISSNTAPSYSHSCFNARGAANCCHVDTSKGNVSCMSAGSPSSAWTAFQFSPFSAEAKASNFDISCFWNGPNSISNCCRFDLQTQAAKCAFTYLPSSQWTNYRYPPFF